MTEKRENRKDKTIFESINIERAKNGFIVMVWLDANGMDNIGYDRPLKFICKNFNEIDEILRGLAW